MCTTLAIGDVIIQKLFHADLPASGPTSQYLPYGFIESLQRGKNGHQIQLKGYEDFAPFHFKLNQLLLRELHNGNVTLLLGTDAGEIGMGLVPGFSLHDELKILVENGLSPYEAIRSATVHAAEVVKKLNGKGNFGTIEVGKKADLVMIEGNPFDDINHLKKIQGVMASGRWYDKPTLQRMLIPQIPVTVGVKHVVDQNNAHYTYFDVVIGKTYSGDLPGAIDFITVTGPKGRLPIRRKDIIYLRNLRDFWIKIPGEPRIGTYTIEVIGSKENGFACDIQAVVKTIPPPDAQYFSPLEGAVLKSNELTFSWKIAKTKEPLYCRMEINKRNGGRVYSTG